MTIVGAFLAGVCLIASVWAQNVFTLIMTIGIGTGLGLGLIYLPAIVSVTTYFEKYRSLATGIAVCGSGFGTFLFAPLTEFLISAFTWRGALLVIAGIVLNCILFGALFRPLDSKKNLKKKPSNVVQVGGDEEMCKLIELIVLKIYENSHTKNNVDEVLQTQTNGHAGDRRSSLQKQAADWKKSEMVRSSSVGHSLTKGSRQHNSQHKVHYDQVDEDTCINGVTHNNGEEMRSALSHPYLNETNDRLHFKSSHRSIAKSGTMSRPDVLYQGSLYNIPNFKSAHDIRGGEVERYGSFRRVDEEAVSSRTHSDFSDRMLVRFKWPRVVIILYLHAILELSLVG